MRIQIDPDRCQGHNRCYALAPELVDVNDLGEAHVLNEGQVPSGLEEKAQLIIDNCPEFAVEELPN
ncbi:MAG: ferredoxin [Actinomycetota bacterium]